MLLTSGGDVRCHFCGGYSAINLVGKSFLALGVKLYFVCKLAYGLGYVFFVRCCCCLQTNPYCVACFVSSCVCAARPIALVATRDAKKEMQLVPQSLTR